MRTVPPTPRAGGLPVPRRPECRRFREQRVGQPEEPTRVETPLRRARPRPYSPGAAGPGSPLLQMTCAQVVVRGGRAGLGTAGRPLSLYPRRLPWGGVWAGKGRGGGAGDGDASAPPDCWPGAGTPGPRASQHPQGRASPVLPAGITPGLPSSGVHLTLAWGGWSASLPRPLPCWPGASAWGRPRGAGGRDGKGFLSQQPGSRKTGQCHLPGSGVSWTAAWWPVLRIL